MFRLICRILSVVALLSLSMCVFAQSAQITGTVSDPYGAVVAHAKVQILQPGTATATQVATNETGSYSATNLKPGSYQIVVSARGFATAKSNVFTLLEGQVLDQDVSLAVEGSQASVVVTAFADLGVAPTLNPATEVAGRELDVLAGPGHTSSFLAAEITPGVIANTGDPYGLSFTRSLNVRGRSDFFLNRTYNGLPLGLIVGGTMDMFDMENVKSERVYAGPQLANQGFGFSTAGGVLDQTLIDPRNVPGAFYNESYGANDFRRSFLRLGTGELPHGAALFVSGTIENASSWKGPGNAERHNATAGYTQKLGNAWNLSADYVHNQQRANTYLPLTYAQTQALAANYLNSFSTATAYNGYFGYNFSDFTEDSLFGAINFKPARHGSFTLSPYILLSQGESSSGASNSTNLTGTSVTVWPQIKHNFGALLNYDNQLRSDLRLSAGYWLASDSADPPPVEQKAFNTTTQTLTWSKLGILSHHIFNAPYAQLDFLKGNTVITGGLRYQLYRYPQMQYYKNLTSLPGNVPYSQILSYNPTPDANAFGATKLYNEIMPNAGVQHQFNDWLKLALSYSRKFARIDIGPQVSSFTGNETGFLADGLTLQSLLNLLRPEADDVIDLIPSVQVGRLVLSPDLYFIKAHNKEVFLLDPVHGLSYYTSFTPTTGYGLDLSAKYEIANAWSIYVSGNSGRESYDTNTQTATSTTLLTAGKQIPNDPKETAKGVLTYRAYGMDVNFAANYISSRYGIADDSQRISPYMASDLNATYNFGRKMHLNGAALNFTTQNIFNRKYIGVLSINEDNLSSISYYTGSPRTVVGSLTYSLVRGERK